MLTNGWKLAIFETFFFFQNWKTQLSKNIWIYVIAFAPIVIQTQQAPQNDRRNLSFVKGTIVVGNRMTRKGPNMTISTGCLFNFRTDFRWDTSGECLWQLLITQCCNRFRFVHKTLEFQLLFSIARLFDFSFFELSSVFFKFCHSQKESQLCSLQSFCNLMLFWP